jgi:FKBP-type peptidyl-prolyl cis-trans isomerase 2
MEVMMFLLKVSFLTAAIAGLLATQLVLGKMESSSPVVDGAVVSIEYTITVPASHVVIRDNVSEFVPGRHELLPNLEKALTGMKKGEEKRVDLRSDDAFGPYDESKKRVISRDRLPAGVEPGMILETEEGAHFVVVELLDSLAAIDFNHPLAGKDVVFDVKILNVVPPSGEHDLELDGVHLDRNLSI